MVGRWKLIELTKELTSEYSHTAIIHQQLPYMEYTFHVLHGGREHDIWCEPHKIIFVLQNVEKFPLYSTVIE